MMQPKLPLRNLTLLWAGWAVLLIGFQLFATARLQPNRPDEVLMWTHTETLATSQNDKPTLIDPFLNELVSWDSEFYLSIALNGYDDPAVRTVSHEGETYSLNYAFFPLYPLTIRAVSWPLSFLGLTPIATATLAGVIISLLGTLVGTIAMYDMARDKLGHDAAFRAAFYLLIFPTAFFYAQVYTEGLFLGFAFASLALMRRKHYLIAAILAAFAVVTRAVGVALGLALVVQVLADETSPPFSLRPLPIRPLIKGGLYAFIPFVAYVTWRWQLGEGFHFVETHFFGHSVLGVLSSTEAWLSVLPSLWGELTSWTGNPTQTGVYYLLEFAMIIFAAVASFRIRDRYPMLFAFSLFIWAIAVFNNSPHSMIRYLMVLPVLYLYLADLGERPNFDKAWTMGSLLLFGLLAMLFSFDFWVA